MITSQRKEQYLKRKDILQKNNTYSQGGNTTLRGVGFFRKKEKYQRK